MACPSLYFAGNGRLRVLTAFAASRSRQESKRNAFVATRSRWLGETAERAVGYIGAGVGGGAIAALGVLARVRADASRRHDIHTKLDLPNVLTEVEVRV